MRRLVRVAVSLGLSLGLFVGAGGPPVVNAADVICYPFGTYYCATLSVVISGVGSGEVTSQFDSTPSGSKRIDCVSTGGVISGTCSLQFAWRTTSTSYDVDLTMTPAAGSHACDSTNLVSCQPETMTDQLTYGLTNGQAKERDMMFTLASRTLQITATGAGSGSVVSSFPGSTASCHFPGDTCIDVADYGTVITLTAKPDAGAIFSAWTGACAGHGSSCKLTMDSAYPTTSISTNVVFGLPGPSSTAAPRRTAGPTATSPASSIGPTTTQAVASPTLGMPGTAATSAPSAAPAATDATASDVPPWIVVVVAGLALAVGGLAAALALALRRRSS